MIKRHLFLLFALLALAALACGASLATNAPATGTPIQPAAEAPAAPTVDINAIVESVLSEVESRLEAQDDAAPVVTPTIQPAAQTELPSAVTESLQDDLIGLYEQANPSVVYILVPPIGSGSGFVYDDDGRIVTNNHVVAGGSRFEVVFANGERRVAELIARDVDSDLAVLQVADLPDGVQSLALAQPGSLQVGQFVVAIGNPFGEQGSMSLGIVSGLGRSLASQRAATTGSTYSLPGVIQTDAPINPGNSGGPLLNLDGQVVGINAAIASTTGAGSGVGFAIPVAAVHRIVPGLIADGEYHYPYMGAGFDDELSLDDQAQFGLSQTQGAYVANVTPGSPADDAGLIAANPNTGQGGDLIIAIDDQAIGDFGDLNSYLVFNTTVGQTIQLTALRGGRQITLPLTLGERP